MFCSLGNRLRSRVALGIGIVIMYCKFLMEYIKKTRTKYLNPTFPIAAVLFISAADANNLNALKRKNVKGSLFLLQCITVINLFQDVANPPFVKLNGKDVKFD